VLATRTRLVLVLVLVQQVLEVLAAWSAFGGF